MSRPLTHLITHWVTSYILLVKFVDIDSSEEVVSLFVFEVDLQKTRNLSTHESEECDHGEGVGVYVTLLWSDTL
jgi:hypothetical protein